MTNPQTIIDQTERYYSLPTGCIMSHCRTKTVAEARAVSMYVCRQLTTRSYEELSCIYKRDTSGIKKNCKKIVNTIGEVHTNGAKRISCSIMNVSKGVTCTRQQLVWDTRGETEHS